MTEDLNVRRPRETARTHPVDSVSKGGPRRATVCSPAGYQPHDLSKGYRVTQPVDLANLKIPKNLGTAAVRPVNGRNPAPLPAKSEKQ